MSKLRLSLAVMLLVAACRGSDGGGGGGDDDDDDDGPGGGDDVAIYDIQSDDMLAGTPVTVRGVVVTAIDSYGKYKGDLYVQEPDGGPFSGVQVFASSDVTLGIEVGDLVDIEGAVKDEFALQEEETDRRLTELKAAEGGALVVTKVGDGVLPEPPVVLPWEMAADDGEAEKWEGVPVRFEGARVFYAPSAAPSDETRENMLVTGPYNIESALTDLDDEIARDTCFASITGIGSYFFDLKLLPRTPADLVVGADTDCLPAEAALAVCEDATDNDYNGYSDCADFGCQEAVSSCVADTTIGAIQAGEVTGTVSLPGVVVTALDSNRVNFWVADATATGANSGVYVYRGKDLLTTDPVDPAVVIGAMIDLRGSVSEYDSGTMAMPAMGDTLTEITYPTISNITAPVEMPAPMTGEAVEALASIADGEPYEGVLVQLTGVEVMATEMGSRVTLSDGAGSIVMDDDAFSYFAPLDDGGVDHIDVGACYSSITGVMHLNYLDDQRRFLPRQASDFVLSADGSACD